MCSKKLKNILQLCPQFNTRTLTAHNICSRRKYTIVCNEQTCLGSSYCAQRGSRQWNSNVKFCFISPVFVNNCLYSTQKSNNRGVTDQLLKSKLTQNSTENDKSVDATKGESTSSDNDPKKDKKKWSWFTGKHAWKAGLLGMGFFAFVMGGQLIYVYGPPLHDEEGNMIPDEFSSLPKWQAYFKRTGKEMSLFKKMIEEPSSRKLLPDPLQEPYYQPPYTLVLEMTGVLVHPDWTLNTGWRFKKRPHVGAFLQQVGMPLFEIVIYTREQGFTAFPIIDGLDPSGFIAFRLFRDATKYMKGTHVKDLSCLNRDLSKVIIVDCDHNAFQLHPRNAVGLRKWTGNDDDYVLTDLAAFLRTIAMSGVDDVRTVLDYYNQFDDPIEAFKENQRKLQEQQEQQARVTADTKDKKSLSGGWFGLSGRKL